MYLYHLAMHFCKCIAMYNALQDRLSRMRQDVARFLDNIWNTGDPVEIGIIEFSHTARILQGMTSLNTEDDLQKLKDAIPAAATGNTCIGCALLEALKVSLNVLLICINRYPKKLFQNSQCTT